MAEYLHNRQQYTEPNGIHSGTQIVKYGVPQGSLLGPHLFKIYVDDLPDNITEGWLYMFADDTTACVVADNIDATIGKLNRMANEIQQWCSNSKLTANLDKTEAMIT